MVLTRVYYMEKNLIDGELLSRGVDIEDLFTRLPFRRCLSFLENYLKEKALKQNPNNFEEIHNYFVNPIPQQKQMQLPKAKAASSQLGAHGENKPPLNIPLADPSQGFAGLAPLGG